MANFTYLVLDANSGAPIQGAAIYPIISLIIFVTFFAGVLWYVKGMRKTQVDELKNIPFE